MRDDSRPWRRRTSGINGSNGFLCVLFAAACIWAYVFGGDWFRYFFIAAVTGGLVVAATMYVARRTVERLGYQSQRRSGLAAALQSQAGGSTSEENTGEAPLPHSNG